MRSRLLVWLATIAVALSAGLFAARPAHAVGAEVFETDQFGNRERRVVGFGNTTPSCCCVTAQHGIVGYGVTACYFPIP